MTPDLLTLARAVVALPGWRWMPGMLAIRVEPLTCCSEGVDPAAFVGRAYRVLDVSQDRDAVRCKGECFRATSRDFGPDLTDAATGGCLLAMVREAFGDNTIHLSPATYDRYDDGEPEIRWHVNRHHEGEDEWMRESGAFGEMEDGHRDPPIVGASEIAALVSALLAAPSTDGADPNVTRPQRGALGPLSLPVSAASLPKMTPAGSGRHGQHSPNDEEIDMSDDTNLTLPGSIPGLLRRGSPVIHVDGRHGVAVEIVPEYDGNQLVAWLMPYDQDLDCCPDVADIALDLSDATGRAHAAWWLHDRWTAMLPPGWIGYVDGDLGPGHYEASIKAAHGQQMVEAEISKLHRTCLHFAAVAPL